METRMIQLLENQPTKEVRSTQLQFDNFQINPGTEVFSFSYNTSEVNSMTICGNQSVITPDGTSHIEIYAGDIDDSSSFVGPFARGDFSDGKLWFGSVPVDSNFIRVRVYNNHSTAVNYNIRYFLKS